MQTVLLFMGRKSNAQGIMLRLRGEPGLRLAHEPDYTGAAAAIGRHGAGVALIEVAESGSCDIAYCLALCDEIRRQHPGCRLLLMCPEQDRACVERAVEAKQTRRIDDFVFYDASMDYLASKLLSM